MPSLELRGWVGALALWRWALAPRLWRCRSCVRLTRGLGQRDRSSTASGQAHSGPRSHRGAASRSAPPSVDPGSDRLRLRIPGRRHLRPVVRQVPCDVSSTKSARVSPDGFRCQRTW